jgi:hypothetical protein
MEEGGRDPGPSLAGTERNGLQRPPASPVGRWHRWAWPCAIGWIALIYLLVYQGRELYHAGVCLAGVGPVADLLRGCSLLMMAALGWALRRRLVALGRKRAVLALLCLAWFVIECWRLAIPEEVTHLLLYGPLGLLLDAALGRHRPAGWRRTCLAIALAALIGLSDECLQALMPDRVFDPRDVWFNALGAALPLGFLRLTEGTNRGLCPRTPAKGEVRPWTPR